MAIDHFNSIESKTLEARGKRILVGFLIVAALTIWGSYQMMCSSPANNSLSDYDISSIVDEREQKLASLLKLLELDDTDYKTHYEVARLYLELGEYDKAIEHLEKARKHALAKKADPAFRYKIMTELAHAHTKRKKMKLSFGV